MLRSRALRFCEKQSTNWNAEFRANALFFSRCVFVAIYLVKGVFLYAQRWILIGISREIEFDLRNDLFRQLERQDADFYQKYRTGDVMARMTNDLNAVRMLLGPALMYSANTIFFTVGALYFLLRISPWLTLVAWAPMPLASILVQYFGRKIHDRFERIQESFSEISAQAQENYSGARLVRAFAREESQMSLFEKLNRQYITRAQRLVQLMGMLWPTLEFILGISMIITLLVGGHEVVAHRITPGDFVAFNTYMILLIWPIIAVGWVVNLFQRGTASVTRIDELLRAKPGIDDSAADSIDSLRTPFFAAKSSFRNLNFSYGDTPVLRNISLKIPAGIEPGHRWPDRVGQDHARQPDLASLRSARGLAAHRWPPDPRISAGSASPEHGNRSAGNISLQRDHSREPGFWRASRLRRRYARSG